MISSMDWYPEFSDDVNILAKECAFFFLKLKPSFIMNGHIELKHGPPVVTFRGVYSCI